MTEKKHLPLAIPLHPYLFDHRFEGRAVLPAVEAMQLLAASTAGAFPAMPVSCIRDCAFDKFLYLEDLSDPASAAAVNEVEIDAAGGARAKLLTRNRLPSVAITRIKQHVGLTFAKPAESPNPPAVDRLFKAGGGFTAIPADRVYGELVPFGPAYQNIDGPVKLSEKGAVARLLSPFREEAACRPLGSPFVLDAAFHAACVWGQRYAGIVAFPVGFAERVIFSPARAGRRYLCRVMPLQNTDDRSALFFDLWICSEEGELCETVRSLRMQDVSGGRWKPPQWVRATGERG